ncbi:MAG: Gfo/Idh/MocA family oxidoreductase, partial [Planctomycetota bacterium]
MKKKTKVLLIGAGGMANDVHYPSLSEMEDVELVALCDLRADRLRETADRFRIEKRYADALEMLDKEKAEAVYLLMPPYHLFDLAIASLRKKLHLFIEKPPAVTTYQARSLAREAEKADVLCMIGFNRRFIPLFRQARERIEAAGPINEVVAHNYKKQNAVYYNGAIDVLTCDAVHAVDILRFLGGCENDVEEVHSVVGRYASEVDNAWNAVVRFESGVTGVLLTNWNVGGRVVSM